MIGDESFSIPMMLIIAVLCGNLQHYRSEVVLADNEGKCNLEFTTFARFTSVPVSCDFFYDFKSDLWHGCASPMIGASFK